MEITVTVNGTPRTATVEDRRTLAEFLREECGLTGTHLACEHGVCGACTVLLDGAGARSCVMPVATAAGKAITTIEGLAGSDAASPGSGVAGLHPVQQAFLEVEAFQCGYCTSGMIMAAVGLLKTNPTPSERDIARLMDRNVCRCGTHLRIVQAIRLAADRLRATAGASR